MARKKKVEQQTVETATVVDVAPAAEAPAPAEVVEEAAEAAEVAEVAAGEVVKEIEEADAEGPSPEEIRAAEVRAERARLAEMWRMGGCSELDGIGAALREVLPGIRARGDVHRPAQLGDVVLTTAELIKALEEAGSEWAAVLRRWYRANHRRAGTSIYVQLALAELDEEVADEQGQGQDEGSADV